MHTVVKGIFINGHQLFLFKTLVFQIYLLNQLFLFIKDEVKLVLEQVLLFANFDLQWSSSNSDYQL